MRAGDETISINDKSVSHGGCVQINSARRGEPLRDEHAGSSRINTSLLVLLILFRAAEGGASVTPRAPIGAGVYARVAVWSIT